MSEPTVTLFCHYACDDGMAPSEQQAQIMFQNLEDRARLRKLGPVVGQRVFWGNIITWSDRFGLSIYQDFTL